MLGKIENVLWTHQFEQYPIPSFICSKSGDVLHCNQLLRRLIFGDVRGHTEISLRHIVGGQEQMLIGALEGLQDVTPNLTVPIAFKTSFNRLELSLMDTVVLARFVAVEEDSEQNRRLLQLGALSGGVFHAIRNPLTVVQGRVELLQMVVDTPNVQKNLEIIFEQSGRISQLLDHVQQVTVQTFVATQFSVTTLLNKVFEDGMVTSHSLQNAFVQNDEGRIRILFELLAHWIRNTGQIRSIDVKIHPVDIQVYFDCALNTDGQQFFHDVCRMIDQPNTLQMTSSTRAQHLQMLQILCLDCKIGLECVKNEGLRLTFRIKEDQPVKEEDASRTVLVVDDDDMLRETIVSLLGLQGYNILTANSAEVALNQWDETVDVVLVDVNLPGMSGLELVAKVRENHPNWMHKVIVISGMTAPELPSDLAFLPKPFSRNQLYKSIEDHLPLKTTL